MQVLLLVGTALAAQPRVASSSREASPVPVMVEQHCANCHNSQMKNGGLDLESIRLVEVAQHPDVWERVVRKLRARQMPPVGMKRLDETTYNTVVAWLSDSLDKASAVHPNPGGSMRAVVCSLESAALCKPASLHPLEPPTSVGLATRQSIVAVATRDQYQKGFRFPLAGSPPCRSALRHAF